MDSLFPNEDALASAMNAVTPHVQFKAGLMSHDATTNLVTADPRKGMLQIVTSPDDSLTHLQWRTRPGTTVETDLIVFPGESVMKRVESTQARVYVLKWLGSASRMFFWMQGGDEAEDEPVIEEVNRILEFGPQQRSPVASASRDRIPSLPPQPPVPPPRLRIPETPVTAPVPDAAAAAARSALSAPVTPVAPSAAAAAGAPAAPAAPATAPAQALTLESFGRMLDALPSVANPAALEAARRAALTEPTVPDLLRSAELSDALRTDEVQAALPALFELLPEGERSVEAMAELMRCPQVLTQAASLTRALRAGQGAALLRSLGLDEADGDAIGMKALLDALKKVHRRE